MGGIIPSRYVGAHHALAVWSAGTAMPNLQKLIAAEDAAERRYIDALKARMPRLSDARLTIGYRLPGRSMNFVLPTRFLQPAVVRAAPKVRLLRRMNTDRI